MKIGLAVSTADALPSAFVAMRDDLGRCIDRCADLGYDGVEFALRHPSQVDVQLSSDSRPPDSKCRASQAGRFSQRTTCILLIRTRPFAIKRWNESSI